MNQKSDIEFLAGPRSRIKEFVFTLQTMLDLIRGFRGLHFIGPCVTFFGSARFSENHPYYLFARNAAAAVSRLGFTVMTGGGPGLMEAANRGAKQAGGKSVGCNIKLPHEQKANIYLDKWVAVKHFFIRKVLLVKYSFAFVVLPGGYGMLDECFEALTLIQTHKIREFPVIVFEKSYHTALIAHLKRTEESGTISPMDLKLLLLTDDIKEAVEFLRVHSIKKFGLLPAKQPRPMRWLFEKT